MEAAEVRRAALALPGVEEYEHGDLPAFRVRGKRFASMLDADGINLMLGAEGISAAVAAWPAVCEPRHFAGRLASVRVDYRALPGEVISDLVAEAWAANAPKRLLRE
jgi:hypothetical protein